MTVPFYVKVDGPKNAVVKFMDWNDSNYNKADTPINAGDTEPFVAASSEGNPDEGHIKFEARERKADGTYGTWRVLSKLDHPQRNKTYHITDADLS